MMDLKDSNWKDLSPRGLIDPPGQDSGPAAPNKKLRPEGVSLQKQTGISLSLFPTLRPFHPELQPWIKTPPLLGFCPAATYFICRGSGELG